MVRSCGRKSVVAPCGKQKVPLSCWFFVAKQQRTGDFEHFSRAKT
jgi:hypothetical protein